MPVTIEIPTAFRRFTGGAPRVDCSAATIADALNELTSRFPDLGRHVRDDQGQIRQFLNVYLNEEDIRFLGGESCTLKEGDRVLLVPSIAALFAPLASGQSKKIEVSDLPNHPFSVDFPSGSQLNIHVRSGDVRVV